MAACRVGALLVVNALLSACATQATLPAQDPGQVVERPVLVATVPAPANPAPAPRLTPAPVTTVPEQRSSPHIDGLYEHPLSDLAQDAAAFLSQRGGNMGIAVLLPDRGIYTQFGDSKFPMASMIKVVILAATLDRAAAQGRDVTLYERDLIEPMITWSDNDSADELWNGLGGGPGLKAYLERIGVDGIDPDPVGYWGDSQASPKAAAYMLAKLAWGDILTPELRAYALDLMTKVSDGQRWGVISPAPERLPAGARVGVKNGWYPDEDGWEVNSAGFMIAADGRNGYTIAVLSDRQESFDETVDAIQRLADMVYNALRWTR